MSGNKRKKLQLPHKERTDLPYLKFTLVKSNIESMQAIHHLAKLTKKHVKYFGIAGNKDKRGITLQEVTLFAGKELFMRGPQVLRHKSFMHNNLRLSSFSYCRKGLHLGQL